MFRAERQATVIWTGDLPHGKGELSGRSGAFQNLPVTWASRIERPDGKTSPEELLAAAHASCYSMALSLTLANAGKQPQQLEVSTTYVFEEVNGAPRITTARLDVRGKVAGASEQEFADLAHQAEQLCPVSNAVRNNVAISLNATLVQ
jgi:osmotically inducible protein OsmC